MTPEESTKETMKTGAVEEGLLWLVSFGDDDDRELRPPEIAEALRLGAIDGDTIVWREGLEDWAPLGSIPSLSRLLPVSGETAAAPTVISPQATAPAAEASRGAPRTMTKEPAKPAVKDSKGGSPQQPKVIPASAVSVPVGQKVSTATDSGASEPSPTENAAPAPVVAPAPVTVASNDANKTAEPWKGRTRHGLPKPPERPAFAFTGAPKDAVAAGAKSPLAGGKFGAASAARADAAKPAGAPKATTPTAPQVKTPDAPKVDKDKGPASSKRGAQNIWSTEEEVAPESVDPESVKPLSPSPAVAKATALSSGTLGGPGKKPPPPAPKRKPPAPSANKTAFLGTPAAPPVAPKPRAQDRADEDIMNLGGGGIGGGLLAPAVDLAAFAEEPATEPIFAAEGPPLSAREVPVVLDEDSVTVPKTAPVAEKPGAATTTAPVAVQKADAGKAAAPVVAAKSPPAESKKSVFPILLGAAAIAIAAIVGLGKTKHETVVAAAEPPEPARTAIPEPVQAQTPEPAATAAPPPETAAVPAPAPEPTPAPEPAKGPTPAAVVHPTTPVVTEKPATTTAGTPPATPAVVAPKPAPAEKPPVEKPAAAAKPAPAPTPEPKSVDMGGDFDKSAAAAALGAAATQASTCRKDGDPSGVAVVHVTFSNAGRATRATIEGPPFAGTATGGCIAAALRSAKVPPYGGDKVTVTKRVVIR